MLVLILAGGCASQRSVTEIIYLKHVSAETEGLLPLVELFGDGCSAQTTLMGNGIIVTIPSTNIAQLSDIRMIIQTLDVAPRSISVGGCSMLFDDELKDPEWEWNMEALKELERAEQIDGSDS